jgi:hypothetical protein
VNISLAQLLPGFVEQWGLEWDEHSGPTPRGRDDSAARREVERVLRSTNASILRMFGD